MDHGGSEGAPFSLPNRFLAFRDVTTRSYQAESESEPYDTHTKLTLVHENILSLLASKGFQSNIQHTHSRIIDIEFFIINKPAKSTINKF